MQAIMNEYGENFLDWRWQLRNSINDVDGLAKWMSLTNEQRAYLVDTGRSSRLPFAITPYFATLMGTSPHCPLFSQVVPSVKEDEHHNEERRDPLGEESREVVPHLIHRYPDRVLFLASDRCATYCRYCTRKRFVGQGPTPTKNDHQRAFDYIRQHDQVREIIFSGGDPLVLSDERIDALLKEAFAIPHIEMVRIHTRMLSFAPMRINKGLQSIFKNYAPLYVVTHFNHPNEITKHTMEAIAKLVDCGVVMLNQSVLLRGINDNTEVLTTLFRMLARNRVRPHYLHQCDVVVGAAHFRVPLHRALQLMESLRGHVSGLIVPTLVIDTPGGNGKMPIYPNPIVSEDHENVYIKGFNGVVSPYPKN